MEEKTYLEGLFGGIKTLCVGLKTTMRELFTKKITEQYPENRKELVMFDRFRGSLWMPHNENNEHKCVGCGACEIACPNGTIKVNTEFYTTEEGRKKKRLVKYDYNLGSCMFCMLCVIACPHDAITFDQSFENAVFDRKKLKLQLNAPGSKLLEKPTPKKVVKPAEKTVAKSVEKAASTQPESSKSVEKTVVKPEDNATLSRPESAVNIKKPSEADKNPVEGKSTVSNLSGVQKKDESSLQGEELKGKSEEKSSN